MNHALVTARWDEEYRQGRYVTEPPLPFVNQILGTLQARQAEFDGIGLYVGCGNGRNYLPLIEAGLKLYGLDLSAEALKQLTNQQPALAPYLICEDFLRFQSQSLFDYLISIQVFQHGNTAQTQNYFGKAAHLLKPGGLFFFRVNSIATQIYYAHSVVERSAQGGLTIQYQEGPKRGLDIHFYSQNELLGLTNANFRLLNTPYEDITQRTHPKTGTWAQWEMIGERR